MRTKTFFMACSLAVLLAGLGVNAAGQRQPYRVSDREVRQLLDRIKDETDTFRKSLDHALDRSRLDGTRREDDINAFVKTFYEETKRLDDRFRDHRSTGPDVEAVLNRAASINGFMNRHPLDARAQRDWSTVRSDLERLAALYNVSWRWERERERERDGDRVVRTELPARPYRITDREVESLLRRIESQADTFRKDLDRALDQSRFNGTRREDDINAFVKEFYKETKTLHDRFDERKSTSGDVQRVLNQSAQINQFMRRNRLNREVQNDWSTLRVSLDELANVYSVSWRWGL